MRSTQMIRVCYKMSPSLHTLPVDIVYRILDDVNDLTLFTSCQNVCKKLNSIIDTYHRYQVRSNSSILPIISLYFT